ncbi:MAG: hypothetical protein AAFO04_25375 [Cyanobacteria bacterium J06592_8]
MFKVKGKADDPFLILTPNWRDNVESILSYEGIAVKHDEEYLWVVLGNVYSSNCKQWNQDESKFQEFTVEGRNCVLKLLKKDIEMYGKKFSPTPWDDLLIEVFNKLVHTFKGDCKGVLNCSDSQFRYVAKFYREQDPALEQEYQAEFLSAEPTNSPVVIPEFEVPSSQNNGKNWGGGGKRETTEERLETRLTWYRQSLSKFLFDNDDTHNLKSCFERLEEMKTSTSPVVKASASSISNLLNNIVSNG